MVKFKVAHHARQLVRQFAVLRLDLLHKFVNGLFVGSGSVAAVAAGAFLTVFSKLASS